MLNLYNISKFIFIALVTLKVFTFMSSECQYFTSSSSFLTTNPEILIKGYYLNGKSNGKVSEPETVGCKSSQKETLIRMKKCRTVFKIFIVGKDS